MQMQKSTVTYKRNRTAIVYIYLYVHDIKYFIILKHNDRNSITWTKMIYLNTYNHQIFYL